MKSEPMELTSNTYYILNSVVARRPGPAVSRAKRWGQRKMLGRPSKAEDPRERKLINGNMKKFSRKSAPDPISGLIMVS
jgi:hypothetical protein